MWNLLISLLYSCCVFRDKESLQSRADHVLKQMEDFAAHEIDYIVNKHNKKRMCC